MNHRMLRMPAGWEWHLLTDGRTPSEWAAKPGAGAYLPGTERPWPGTAPAGTEQPRTAATPGPEQARAGSETAETEQARPGSGTVGTDEARPGSVPAGTEQERSGSGTDWQPVSPDMRSGSDPARPEAGQTATVRLQPVWAFAGPEHGLTGAGSRIANTPGADTEGAIPLAGMTRAAALAAIKRRLPECANWLDASVERRDALAVSTETPESGETVFGTLPLRMSPDEGDVCPLHFWLTEKRLVTLQFDLRFTLRLQRSPWEERLVRASCAPEAFAVILTAALETMRAGFETFERRLAGLEAEAERTGRPIPAETIAELQRGLLQWNRQLLAVVEAESAAAESFGKRLTDSEPYRRLQRRLGLVRALIGRHSEALGALAAFGGAAEPRKRGPLLRALAVVSVLPVPVAAAGALWGMYAGHAPPADEPWGFAAVCGGAALLSLILYGWLRRVARNATESGAGARNARGGDRSAAVRDGAFTGAGTAGYGQPGAPGTGPPGPVGPGGHGGHGGLPSRSSRLKRR